MKQEYKKQAAAIAAAAKISQINDDMQQAVEKGAKIDKNIYTALLQVKNETTRFINLFDRLTGYEKADNSNGSQRQQGAD